MHPATDAAIVAVGAVLAMALRELHRLTFEGESVGSVVVDCAPDGSIDVYTQDSEGRPLAGYSL